MLKTSCCLWGAPGALVCVYPHQCGERCASQNWRRPTSLDRYTPTCPVFRMFTPTNPTPTVCSGMFRNVENKKSLETDKFSWRSVSQLSAGELDSYSRVWFHRKVLVAICVQIGQQDQWARILCGYVFPVCVCWVKHHHVMWCRDSTTRISLSADLGWGRSTALIQAPLCCDGRRSLNSFESPENTYTNAPTKMDKQKTRMNFDRGISWDVHLSPSKRCSFEKLWAAPCCNWGIWRRKQLAWHPKKGIWSIAGLPRYERVLSPVTHQVHFLSVWSRRVLPHA